MKKRIYALTSMVFFAGSAAQAGAIMDIVPSSTYPIAIAQNGQTYLTYVVKNNTSRTINSLSIDPAFGGAGRSLSLYVSTNQCGILAPNASCVFVVTMQGINQHAFTTLTPRVCAYNGSACSIPTQNNRVTVTASPNKLLGKWKE